MIRYFLDGFHICFTRALLLGCVCILGIWIGTSACYNAGLPVGINVATFVMSFLYSALIFTAGNSIYSKVQFNRSVNDHCL